MRSPRASTPRKVHLKTVVERIHSGKCTEDDLRDWFSIELHDGIDPGAVPDGPPEVRLNFRNVDVNGLESLAHFGVGALAIDAIKAVLAQRPAFDLPHTFRSAAAVVPIIADGDSWFNLPDIRFPISIPPTLIDYLKRSWHVKNIAHWGDTLDDIINKREYADYLTQDSRILLFSAGGNDALGGGSLFSLLHQRKPTDKDPDNAGLYLRREFHQLMRDLERKISSFAGTVLQDFPKVHILMHGYDYAVPRLNGHWLGRHLDARGFDPVWQPDFCKAIIKAMVQRYNVCLSNVDRKYRNFHYVDLTDTVNGRWWDELHPNPEGARALSEKYDAAIMKVVTERALADHIV